LCRKDWAKTITSQKITLELMRSQLSDKESEFTKLKNYMQLAVRDQGSGIEHFTK